MSSPFFTPPPHCRGQLGFPMGTHHACGTCHQSYICDAADCPLPLNRLCPTCQGSASHLEALAEERGRHGFQPLEPKLRQQGFLFGQEV